MREITHEREFASDDRLAAGRLPLLFAMLANLIATKLGSRWPDEGSIREVLAEPDLAAVWRMYRDATDAAKDVDDDADRLHPDDRVMRLAVRRGYGALDAIRAARANVAISKDEVDEAADLQRAKRYERDRKRLSRRLARAGTDWPLWERMTITGLIVAVIRLRPCYAGIMDLADLVRAIGTDLDDD